MSFVFRPSRLPRTLCLLPSFARGRRIQRASPASPRTRTRILQSTSSSLFPPHTSPLVKAPALLVRKVEQPAAHPRWELTHADTEREDYHTVRGRTKSLASPCRCTAPFVALSPQRNNHRAEPWGTESRNAAKGRRKLFETDGAPYGRGRGVGDQGVGR